MDEINSSSQFINFGDWGMTTDINKLAEALSKAQGEIDIAKKDKSNPFFRSNYADLPSVYKASRAALSKHGLSVSQVMAGTDLVTILMHSTGQRIWGKYPIKPIKDDPQGRGSAQTYGRRYCYNGVVGVASEDDDDDGERAHGRGNGFVKAEIPPVPETPIPKTSAARSSSEGDIMEVAPHCACGTKMVLSRFIDKDLGHKPWFCPECKAKKPRV
jgi:hypothetical protein